MREEEENMLEKLFHLKENKTTVKTEVTAGITSFFTMAYIIFVNPQIWMPVQSCWQPVLLRQSAPS